jgi:hypothetical protein
MMSALIRSTAGPLIRPRLRRGHLLPASGAKGVPGRVDPLQNRETAATSVGTAVFPPCGVKGVPGSVDPLKNRPAAATPVGTAFSPPGGEKVPEGRMRGGTPARVAALLPDRPRVRRGHPLPESGAKGVPVPGPSPLHPQPPHRRIPRARDLHA